ncbi:MAG: hypothetical protein QNL33_15930 [Akkermansiaceae bacterium]|jgi:hypothetical protein
MKALFLLGIFLPANGQETNKITGKIDDGSEKAVVSAPSPSYRVLSTVTKTRKLREVTFRQVEAPKISESLAWSSPTEQLETEKSNHSFVVSSITYPGKGTKVRWWSTSKGENTAYECWSNVDWKNLGGFHRFESSSQSFTFMMFHQVSQNLKKEETPPNLPGITQGARYMVIAGDEENDAAMDFIEGLHEIYDLRGQDLKIAAANREIAAERRRIEKKQDAENPSVKKIEVNFWPLSPKQKAR